MLLSIFLLTLGFIFLIKGADYFIEGASALALKFNISQIVIGLTVVAFGTSAPELVINVLAALSGNPDISFGNIIGSNIINIFLILGIAGIIRPLKTEKNTVWREIPFALLAVMALWVLVNDDILNNTTAMLSRSDGIILLLFFTVFIIYSFAIATVQSKDTPDIEIISIKKVMVFLLIGITGLVLGGQMAVSNALKIAAELGLSDKLIGLTIIALGTSLPELVTSAVAAYRGKSDIALGNIIGSNIFNIFFILALTAIIKPLPFQYVLNYDLMVLFAATIILFFTMFTGKKRSLDRWESIILLFLYLCYSVYLLYRQ